MPRFVLSLFLSSSLVWSVAGLVIRDYNYVRYIDNTTFANMKDTLFNYNGQDRAATNIFLGIYTDDSCRQAVGSPAFLGVQRHAGGNTVLPVLLPAAEISSTATDRVRNALLKVFEEQPGICGAVYFYRFGDFLSDPNDVTTELEYQDFNPWTIDKTRVSVGFVNKFPYTVEILWHEELGESPMHQSFMNPNDEMHVTSMIGHVFSVRKVTNIDDDDEERPIVDYFVVHELRFVFSPVNRLETCEIDPSTWQAVFVDPAHLTCDNMETRFIEFSQHVWHITRLGLNFVQPQLVRAASISQHGFEMRKLPESTFNWLRSWYENERRLQEQVESTSGPCMNQKVAPSMVTHIHPEGKQILERSVRPILREWNGGGEIRMTSIYGVRRYTNGSVLRMHVDTAQTHVVSAIINVAQSVEKDWPVLILDHDYNEHRVVMKPGDMLLYESAKLLHGRPDVFVGEYYDNIFVHFQPVSGWDYEWI